MTLLDVRSAEDARRLLRAAAERSLLPGTASTWAELLFDGDEWSEASDPSQALLAALTELHAGLAEHLRTVPARLRAEWLSDRLGIAPLPAVPDRVVVAATADPARTPLVLAVGTALRAKDSAGTDRRYATTETLTVHGIEVIDVVSHGAEVGAGGVVVDSAARWSDRSVPFAPFAAGNAPAAHRFFVLSDLLAFPDGALTVRLTFTDADPTPLVDATWEHSKPGGVGVGVAAGHTGSSIDIQLLGGCTPAEVLGTTSPYLCVSLAAGQADAGTLGFAPSSVEVEVVERLNVRPDAAFANDGRLDPTKEMQPFGPTPRRGDAFYVRSDEAFGKPLADATVHLTLLEPGDGTMSGVPWSPVPHSARASALSAASAFEDLGGGIFADVVAIIEGFRAAADPKIDWQRYDGSAWAHLEDTGSELRTVVLPGATPASQPLSHAVEIGESGHFVRAFLAEGDFGWAAHVQNIARFAAEAAADDEPDAALLIPPDPPILTAVSIDYTTVAAPPTALASVDGWATRHPPATGPHHAFGLPFDLSGDRAGMLAIGLRIGDGALGSGVALYIDVASAPACGSDPASPLRWEHWTRDGDWRALDVADGTLGLRQSGLLRFVAPLDWPEGSQGVSAADGRWIRAVTSAPETVGELLAIVPDAVEAVQQAPASYEPLAAAQVKGLLVAAPGVKKLTNPIAGRPGRAPEDPEALGYLERASGAVRHRGRAATAWDCEAIIQERFPEVAAVRCLPHTDAQGDTAPGWIGAVIVPRTVDRMPLPSVSLAERIRGELAAALPLHAQFAVLCPLYVAVTVEAAIVLVPGAAAVDARARIVSALEELLHPTATEPVRFGRELFASSVAAWLEGQPDVDHLESFALLVAGAGVERVTVDACRGIVASAGDHRLTLREQL